ncbi:hydroxymethylglutaryl-CoA synthase [Nocardia sp. alder85J]|uniref:hydroxymethylglutaryl-CoA synthase n=1 Tax=Nocardia sp. alder85J TaxID=2862949 RepID=UPI001CD774C8|nr:hydroxymethylglutaryl-CoA synthase [Nocardia sp. alder85J]MCX4095786.1 hydroxymethylglutaryl-CoA synthase [Nocardia sp. alder85J]
MSTLPIGIHDLSFATTHYVLDHATLARHHDVEIGKYHHGIGQESMSVPAADEDIVTLAAAAAAPVLDRHGTANLRTLLLATETGVDQSKAAGLYLHSLLDLPSTMRVVELKQACYAATAALQLGTALIARDPRQQVLVIATDIAKYDLDSAAEATQGAAAVAILLSAEPAIAELDPISGIHSTDVMDFWRPNYRTTPVVDGKLSIGAYLTAAEGAWTDYRRRGGRAFDDFAAFCYHQPFTKMAYKAHHHLLKAEGRTPEPAEVDALLGATTQYNRLIGNTYTASVYLALASLLDHSDDLTGAPIALLSYGSGSVAEFFSAVPVSGYRDALRTVAHHDALAARKPVDYNHYRALHSASPPADGGYHTTAEETAAPYRLAAVNGHVRVYDHSGSRTRPQLAGGGGERVAALVPTDFSAE